MRVSQKKINQTLKKQIKKTFAQAITDLKNTDETDTFLKDFFTDTEYEAFSKRLAIAYWLKKGRTYKNIKNNLKVSSATIASTQTDMNKSGFKLILEKVEAEEWASQWAKKIKKFVSK